MDLNEWGKYFIRGLFAQEFALSVLINFINSYRFWYILYVLYLVSLNCEVMYISCCSFSVAGEQAASE